eukprot:scaffold74742_cov29-Tisochrysis_lutea.AAC.2
MVSVIIEARVEGFCNDSTVATTQRRSPLFPTQFRSSCVQIRNRSNRCVALTSAAWHGPTLHTALARLAEAMSAKALTLALEECALTTGLRCNRAVARGRAPLRRTNNGGNVEYGVWGGCGKINLALQK